LKAASKAGVTYFKPGYWKYAPADNITARVKEVGAEIKRLSELAAFALPLELPYLELRSLATEARQKLDRIRPTSLAQAARVPGISPSDLHNLVIEATRWRRRVA